jgi:predicted nuclease with TOPRIM domain
MQEELQRKLDELKKEFEVGQNRLRELETEQAYVRETMLRISGAIQVLQELIDGPKKEAQDSDRTLEARAVS